MSLTTLLVVFLIVALIGGLPAWGFHQYGYYPSGALGTVLIVILILMLMGRL